MHKHNSEIEVLAPETPDAAETQNAILQPFFATKPEVAAIKRTQTVAERRKWSLYFEAHGCLHCQQKIERHLGCGLCATCHNKIYSRLQRVIHNAERETCRPMPPAMDATKLARRALAPSIRKLGGATKLLESERLALP